MDRDAARRLVVERNLAAAAFGHLTEALLELPFESLGPVKGLLKRFFSAGPWGDDDDDALADAVGAGTGRWERRLADDLTLAFGWGPAGFGVDLRSGAAEAHPPPPGDDPVAASFDGPVVPEATPNPRTVRFGVGHRIHDGPSRWYDSPAGVDDARAARLFDRFDEVANVLIGPDFVAVGLHRAGDWERLLRAVLEEVTATFADLADAGAGVAARGPVGTGPPWAGSRPEAPGGGGRVSRLEQAWRDLGALRPADPSDLAVVRTAAAGDDQFHRQVAANLLGEADPGTAAEDWAALVADPVRSVRRAAVDAMVDAGREELRPLLESALGDGDAWVRWKALRGLAELGGGPSRDAIAAMAADPDFRVRLEAAAALRPA